MSANRKQLLLTCTGSALEYYDFMIFALFLAPISQTFFPQDSTFLASIKSLCIFAAAYFIRPIGGIIFGHFGDKSNRTRVFSNSLLLMAVATFGIAVAPSYSTLGIIGACIIVICRLLQGIAQGAELPGAITIIAESSEKSQGGYNNGVLFLSVGLGTILASFVAYIIHHFFTEDDILAYAWRIPFLLGAIIAVIGYFFRSANTPRQPPHKTPSHTFIPIAEVFKFHKGNLFTGICLTLIPATMIVLALFIPKLFHNQASKLYNHIFMIQTLAYILSICILPKLGSYSENKGHSTMYLRANVLLFIGIIPLFWLSHFESTILFFIFLTCYQLIIILFVANYPCLLCQLFPKHIRYTGVATCYNVGFSLAALVPLCVEYITRIYPSLYVMPLILLCISCLSMFALTHYANPSKAFV